MIRFNFENFTTSALEHFLFALGLKRENEVLETLKSELPTELAHEMNRLLDWSERIISGRNAIMNAYEKMHLLKLSDYQTSTEKLCSEMPTNGGKVREFYCQVHKDDEIYMVMFTDQEDTFMQLKPGFSVRKYNGQGIPEFGSIAMKSVKEIPYEWEDVPLTDSISREVTAVAMYSETKTLNRNTNGIAEMLTYFPPSAIERE